MSKKILFLISLVLFSRAPFVDAISAAEAINSTGSNHCLFSERWSFGKNIATEWQDEYRSFLRGTLSPARAFSEALAMRRFTKNVESRLFAEYWISRALYQAGLVHVAFSGFNTIAEGAVTEETQLIRVAAIGCINQIAEKYPAFSLSAKIYIKLKSHLETKLDAAAEKTILIFTARYFKQQLSNGAPDSDLKQLLTSLERHKDMKNVSKSLFLAKNGFHKEVVQLLEPYLKKPASQDLVSNLVQRDQLRLILARSYFVIGEYQKAADQLKLIRKSSNELAKALSELAWQYLMDEKYQDAIGTAMSLQAGGMRRTFTPEALMVMAMSLNEICQFPDSLKAIASFKSNYEKTYKWLQSWDSTRKNGETVDLYRSAIDFLKKKSEIPEHVATEWLRSPVFLASQGELNLIASEGRSSAVLGKQGAREQKLLAQQIRLTAKELKPEIRLARAKMKPGEALPVQIKSQLNALKKMLVHYNRLKSGAPIWRVVLANSEKQALVREFRLIAQVKKDFTNRNSKMLKQLEEVAENNQLIEIEIFNGATHDIIWQNAHPDYKQVAQQFETDQVASPEKSWDWGKTRALAEESGEIWEDELGSFKANIFDNCSSKDRYLALKRNVSI